MAVLGDTHYESWQPHQDISDEPCWWAISICSLHNTDFDWLTETFHQLPDIASNLLMNMHIICCIQLERQLNHTISLANDKSAQRDAIFSPHCRPPFRGRRTAKNLISWRWSLPLPTNPVWWRSMHAISSYCGNRPANKHTHRHTNRTNYNTLHRSFASRQCNQLQLSFKFQHSCTLCTKNLQMYIQINSIL